MKTKIVGILVCMLLLVSAFAVAAPTNKMVTSVSPVPSPINGKKGTPSASPLNLLSSLLGKTVYGCDITLVNKTLVSFTLDNPGVMHNITIATSNYSLSGGCWVNGVWWACEWSWYSHNNSNIWKINPATGDMTLVGPSETSDPHGLEGLAYVDESGIMYACSSINLYTINMFTGKGTKIGGFGVAGILMVSIASDSAGNLYGESLGTPGKLYAINKTSGKASLIGSLGMTLGYNQDMAFDKDTDQLYLAAGYMINQTTWGDALYSCDEHTAACTKIGEFPIWAWIDAFAIPYGPYLEVSSIKGGVGVHAVINNIGPVNMTHLPWKIDVKGGVILMGKTRNGTIDIAAGKSQTLNSFVLGFGKSTIAVTIGGLTKEATGTVFLFFVLGVKEV